MGVVISEDSELGKELKKWNKEYRYEPYPAMLYKAQPSFASNGKVLVIETAPSRYKFAAGPEGDNAYAAAELAVLSFNSSNQLIVRSDSELDAARNDGWRESPTAAMEFHEGLQRDISTAAAEAAHAATRMSGKAQAERKALDAATDKHVTK
jgi:hypothetical protein